MAIKPKDDKIDKVFDYIFQIVVSLLKYGPSFHLALLQPKYNLKLELKLEVVSIHLNRKRKKQELIGNIDEFSSNLTCI